MFLQFPIRYKCLNTVQQLSETQMHFLKYTKCMTGCNPKTLNVRGLCLHKYHNTLHTKQTLSLNRKRPGNLYTWRVFLYRLLLKQVRAASALRSQTCSIDLVQSRLLAQHEPSSGAVSPDEYQLQR
jgi:hypothetical protein